MDRKRSPTCVVEGRFFVGKPSGVVMSMQCHFIFIVEGFHFIFSNCHTDNKAMPFKELVIKLGEGMGVSDSIEPVGVKEGICRNEVVMVYL